MSCVGHVGGMAARDSLGSGQTQLNTKAEITAMTTFNNLTKKNSYYFNMLLQFCLVRLFYDLENAFLYYSINKMFLPRCRLSIYSRYDF
jgi:hypothetical protein